jgi:hypothetical protein
MAPVGETLAVVSQPRIPGHLYQARGHGVCGEPTEEAQGVAKAQLPREPASSAAVLPIRGFLDTRSVNEPGSDEPGPDHAERHAGRTMSARFVRAYHRCSDG